MLTSSKAAGVLKSLSDETLMEMVAVRDDERAFDELYRRWNRAVRFYILKRVHDWHKADDGCATVFIQLFKKRGRYQTGQKFGRWVFAFARLCVKWIRAACYRVRITAGIEEHLDVADYSPRIFEQLIAAERSQILRKRMRLWLSPEAVNTVEHALEGSLPRYGSNVRALNDAYDKLRIDPILARLS